MKHRYAFFSALLATSLMMGCANTNQELEGSEDLNPIISSAYQAVDRLLTEPALKQVQGSQQRVLVASLVDVNQLTQTSLFGKMMAEQLASRLVQKGVTVVEVKLRTSLFMTEKSGEMLLSREIKEVGSTHSADAVLVGTYADAGSSGVYVTVKLIRTRDAVTLSATNFKIEKRLVASTLR